MLKLLASGHRAAFMYVMLVICLPLLTLIGFGLLHLWQNQWVIPVTMTWLAITLLGYAAYRFWPANSPRKPATQTRLHPDNTDNPSPDALKNLPVRLEERADWTAIDRKVWHQSVEMVEDILTVKPTWQELPDFALKILTSVSAHYDKPNQGSTFDLISKNFKNSSTSYRFTLPELLLLLSITSNRYRQLILTHVPFAERIRISAILNLYERQDQIKTGAGWINTLRRAARLVNPLAAVAGELRDQFTNQIFSNLSDKVQNDLKRLLLQEFVQVAMDLYSGRLKSAGEELSHYQSQRHSKDLSAMATPLEPLRVVLTGQVSAGKSSLVNALVETLKAETDILPTTDKTVVHALHLPDNSGQAITNNNETETHQVDVHLIDTVGLVDDADSIQGALQEAQQADLLIWVTRATQPARAPEAALYEALMQIHIDDPSRREPPILLIMTHVDQLSPKSEWQPPYDLSSETPKARNIKRAMDSCRQQIGLHELTPAIPMALAQKREPYNVDALIAQILLLRSEAAQTQLNRRRIERDMNTGGWRDRWEQASKLGTVTGKLLTRSILGE